MPKKPVKKPMEHLPRIGSFTEKILILMTKEEKTKLLDARGKLGVPMADIMRHCTFKIGLPHLLRSKQT